MHGRDAIRARLDARHRLLPFPSSHLPVPGERPRRFAEGGVAPPGLATSGLPHGATPCGQYLRGFLRAVPRFTGPAFGPLPGPTTEPPCFSDAGPVTHPQARISILLRGRRPGQRTREGVSTLEARTSCRWSPWRWLITTEALLLSSASAWSGEVVDRSEQSGDSVVEDLRPGG